MFRFNATDYQGIEHTVTVPGTVILKKPEYKLYLAVCRGVYTVHYGLSTSRFNELITAMADFSNCFVHAAESEGELNTENQTI